MGRGPLPGQCGVVVAHGTRIVAAEVFATPELLAGQWTAMARSHVLDAPWQVNGRPSATKALRFLRRLATGDAIEADGVGLGTERHVRTAALSARHFSGTTTWCTPAASHWRREPCRQVPLSHPSATMSAREREDHQGLQHH